MTFLIFHFPFRPEEHPWIQIDLLTPKLISGIATQGSPDTERWVTSYTVSYSVDGVTFIPYTIWPGEPTPYVFPANTDQNTYVRNLFNRDIIARYVRVQPVSGSPGGMAMRVEILGCSSPTPITPTVQPTAAPPGLTGPTPTMGPGVSPTTTSYTTQVHSEYFRPRTSWA